MLVKSICEQRKGKRVAVERLMKGKGWGGIKKTRKGIEKYQISIYNQWRFSRFKVGYALQLPAVYIIVSMTLRAHVNGD